MEVKKSNHPPLPLIFLATIIGFAGGWFPLIFQRALALASDRAGVISAEAFKLVNRGGREIGQLQSVPATGGYGFFLYDTRSRCRLEMCLFPDGRPVIGLYDESFIPKALLKLEWEKNIPMFFMKDPHDRNRLILSLDLKNSDEPVLVCFDENGVKKEVFGKFEMP